MATVLWDVGTLRTLDDQSFVKVVNDHVLPRSDPDGRVWAALYDPALVERTCVALVQLLNRVNAQLASRRAELELTRQDCLRQPDGRRAWFAAKAEHDAWRARAIGWKRQAETRLLTAKEHRRQARSAIAKQRQPRDEQHARDALHRLAVAVHHQQMETQARTNDGVHEQQTGCCGRRSTRSRSPTVPSP
jgi:hypothetical protein